MKGEKAEYYISFEKAFMFPAPKRIRKALNEVKGFAAKHTRAGKISVSNEVNEFIHKNSKNIPRGIGAVLYKEKDKVSVFLQKGTGLEAYIKKMAEEKRNKEASKKKEEKAAEKESAKKQEKKPMAKEEEDEADKKKLLEEKRLKEEAGKSIEMKRG